jgi:hypothetical protein
MEENKLIAEFMGLRKGFTTVKYYHPVTRARVISNDTKEECFLIHEDDVTIYTDRPGFEWQYIDDENYLVTKVDELKYDSDWNWLMQVVDKIEKLGATIRVKSNYNPFIKLNVHQVTIEIEKGELSEGNKSFLGDGFIYQNHSNSNLIKIEAYYESVVNFIKWYNDEQNSN